MGGSIVGRVARLWRYPVKSMAGCVTDVLDVDENGARGDRSFAVRDRDTGVVVSLDSAPELLQVAVQQEEPGASPKLLIPGALDWIPWDQCDRALSAYLGRDVWIGRRTDVASDLSFDYGLPVRNSARQGFTDVPGVLHLISSASLAWLDAEDVDAQRVRANVELELNLPALGEHSLVGRLLLVGAVVMQVSEVTERCGLLDASRPGRPAQPGSLMRVQQSTGGGLGVNARVHLPGPLRIGDPVQLGQVS